MAHTLQGYRFRLTARVLKTVNLETVNLETKTSRHNTFQGWVAIALLTTLSSACSDSSDQSQPTAAPLEWRTFAGEPERTFFNDRETQITRDNVHELQILWTFPTGAIITASPTVAKIQLPEGPRDIVYTQSWDGYMYALHVATGEELWRYQTKFQEVSFPNTGSAHVERVNGEETVFFGAGERFYALDAKTGEEIWIFDAGTGCRNDGAGLPPFTGRETRSSPRP